MKDRLLFAVCLCGLRLTAEWINMPPVPIRRLILHTESVVRKRPDNAEAYYLLGRLHSLAFAMRFAAGARLPRGKVPVLDGFTPDRASREVTGHLEPTDIAHATASLANYRRAVELKPSLALYHFSLGWMQEQCSRFAKQLGNLPSHDWVDLALAEYRAAYRLALPEEAKRDYYVDTFLTDEAGSAIVEILKRRHGNELEIEEILTTIADLRRRPQMVTPLIFSLNPDASLLNLLSSHKVRFDLDGFGDERQWPWIQPDTYVLVWDPDRSGKIASGRQLFGSVTWWMFWKNGFEPLAALDDNQNGLLAGRELDGIAVWRDANSNGVADAGEVVPAKDFGIVEIRVTPRQIDGELLCYGGIILQDRKALTIFDWTPISSSVIEPQPTGTSAKNAQMPRSKSHPVR